MTAALEEHLAAYADPGPEGLLFPAPEGGFLRLENFRRRVWTPATVAAGVAPLRVHDLRHTCASLAIAAGADVKVLQRMLGHASAALTLDRYGHLLPGQAQSVADRLDEMARAATAGCDHAGHLDHDGRSGARGSRRMSRPARIEAVEPLGGLRLRLTFSDGLVRELDLGPMLDGCLVALRDPVRLAEAKVDEVAGTVTWPDGFDLDPDVLHGDHPPAAGMGPIVIREHIGR